MSKKVGQTNKSWFEEIVGICHCGHADRAHVMNMGQCLYIKCKCEEFDYASEGRIPSYTGKESNK